MRCINPNVVVVADIDGGIGLVTFFRNMVLDVLNMGVKGRLQII